MFRSVSQDVVANENGGNANGNHGATAPPVPFGRRRTRAQAKLEIHARREQLKRTREAMEAMARRHAKRDAPAATPPPRKAVVQVGASLGDGLAVEHTPTKSEPRSPPAVRRVGVAAPPVTVPTPDKATTATATATAADAQSPTATAATTRRLPVRGIAQSSSSGPHGPSRKRMISFSPERAERPINEAAERLKRQRNLAATEKLQLRLEGIPVRTPEKPAADASTATMTRKSPSTQPRTPSPVTASVSSAREVAVAPSPVPPATQQTATASATLPRSESPDSQPSNVTMELHSDAAVEEEDAHAAGVAERAPSRSSAAAAGVRCKKELDFTAVDGDAAMGSSAQGGNETDKPQREEETPRPSEDAEMLQSEPVEEQQDDEEASATATATATGTADEATTGKVQHAATQDAAPQLSIGFGDAPFTSTSTIEDVGLFNCELDVEFTGGVYGEGTDGKVSAAMVRGQKVALKRAKPHDGFPEDEAKGRSAVELHYLRRVRHVPGFVQCLGLCDGIEHTCIALEVMDCKLSDYLRRYGQHTKGRATSSSSSCSSSKRRRFTLSLEATKSMLRQICQPMAVLHDHVNVAHGDLACRNILVRLPPRGYEQKWEPVVKLSDFGRVKTPASEPPLFDGGFSFAKNGDVGAFAREILYRLLVGEIVPASCTETRSLHKHLQDVVVQRVPDAAKEKLGPYYRLFLRCAGWGVRPSFREIADHLDDLEYFATSDNGFFPLRPLGGVSSSSSSSSSSAALENASFLSPMVESGRGKAPSSGSRNKYETPTTANPRGLSTTAPTATGTTSGGVRMLPGKSLPADGATASTATAAAKAVNWLKARSVHPGQGGQQLPKLGARPAASTPSNVASTPNGRPAMVPKKTPPSAGGGAASAGTSRRSLQILNQIMLKEKKKC